MNTSRRNAITPELTAPSTVSDRNQGDNSEGGDIQYTPLPVIHSVSTPSVRRKVCQSPCHISVSANWKWSILQPQHCGLPYHFHLHKFWKWPRPDDQIQIQKIKSILTRQCRTMKFCLPCKWTGFCTAAACEWNRFGTASASSGIRTRSRNFAGDFDNIFVCAHKYTVIPISCIHST